VQDERVTLADILAGAFERPSHDATIRELRVEFGREQVALDIEFWVGDLDADSKCSWLKREADESVSPVTFAMALQTLAMALLVTKTMGVVRRRFRTPRL